MGKAAAKDKLTTTRADDGIEQLLDAAAVRSAQSQLLSNLMGMGWRLAIAILIPIVAGVQLDKRFNSKPSYALTGFILAIALASYMIYGEYKEIQAEQAKEDAATKPRRKKGNA